MTLVEKITSFVSSSDQPTTRAGTQDKETRAMVTVPWIGRSSNGLYVGEDRSVWLYRKLPAYSYSWEPFDTRIAAGSALHQMLIEIGKTSKPPAMGEFASLAKNRKVHFFSHVRYVRPSLPKGASPDLANFLTEVFESDGTAVPEQVTMIGIELWPSGTFNRRRNRSMVKQLRQFVTQFTNTDMPDIDKYEADMIEVSTLLGRYDAVVPTTSDLRTMERWLSGGSTREPFYIEEVDRLIVRDRNTHTFDRWIHLRDLAVAADEDGDHQRADELALEAESQITAGGNVIQFLAIPEEGLPGNGMGVAPDAPWISDAQQHENAAVTVSLRFQLEPASITRNRARKTQRRATKQTIEEEEANAKFSASAALERVELTETLVGAQSVEDYYAMSGEPSIVKLSQIFAWVMKDASEESFDDFWRAKYELDAVPLLQRQAEALLETLPCSPMLAAPQRPFVHDAMISLIAHSGIGSAGTLGDDITASSNTEKLGMFAGIAHPGGTPNWLNPFAASEQNSAPTMAVIGDPGSGKLTTLDTPIPTPSGWTTMGELKVGDKVLGRDGRPCNVVYTSEVNEQPDLYAIHFDDGQVIHADFDHQWVVSSRASRFQVQRPNRRQAIRNWDKHQNVIAAIEALADLYDHDELLTASEIFRAGREHVEGFPFHGPVPVGIALNFVGCPSDIVRREFAGAFRNSSVTKRDPVVLFPVIRFLEVNIAHWQGTSNAMATRWAKKIASEIIASRKVIADVLANDPDEEATASDITRRLIAAGALIAPSNNSTLAKAARNAGVQGRNGFATVVAPRSGQLVVPRDRTVYPAALAFKSLATRARQRFGDRPNSEAGEMVMTTGEMLADGVRLSLDSDRVNFATRVAAALELPIADLQLSPYVLGVWLGDGTRGSGQITQGTSEVCTDSAGLTDQAFMIRELAEFEAHPIPSSDKTIGTRGLQSRLRDAGVLLEKHIPMAYLRSSFAQRLALLQGIMDTDGSIDDRGSCELCLCDERLVTDALELIRSLGIKASMSSGDAVITEADPLNPGQKRRRVTGTRWRICFTPSIPVFRLPRKLARVKAETRETNRWLYITKVEQIDSRPGKCIQVDSPDSTYLAAGFVPTHNTFLVQALLYQVALQGISAWFVNPKGADSLRSYADFCGGETIVISQVEPGAFDPFRYAEGATIVEIALEHISTSLNAHGDGLNRNQTIALSQALFDGMTNHVGCVGKCLEFLPPEHSELAKQIRDWAGTNTNFALGISTVPRGPMGANRRFTLVEFDQESALPENTNPNELSMTENSALAGQRLMWRAGIEVMRAAGGGVVAGDEAWTFLSSPQAASVINGLNRKGRSLGIFLILMTQKIADIATSDMEGYLSRVGIMKLDDEREIAAALELCRMEKTPELVDLIRASKPAPPNPGDPAREIPATPARPSRMIFRDLQGRHGLVTVEPIPEAYRRRWSTNRADKAQIALEESPSNFESPNPYESINE